MPYDSETALYRYHFDPLDMLAKTTLHQQALLRFYCRDRLVTEIESETQRSVFQADHLLALQQSHRGVAETTLLVTDPKRSLLAGGIPFRSFAYTPYGHLSPQSGVLSMLGFNGERADPVTGHYLMGNGYRAFNPVLMRFNSPDSWSPFGKGGINAYAAFKSDPINHVDPTGHAPYPFMVLKAANRFKNGLTSMKRHARSALGDEQITNGTPLKNKLHLRLKEDISKAMNNDEGLLTKMISNLDDLDIINNQKFDYKFIYTDRSELVIGRFSNRTPSHPVLAELASSPRVISAGHIAKRNGTIILSNQTGHYYMPGIDTTGPVFSFLKKLGIERIGITAHLLRNERDYGHIPPNYIP